jgi:hypothetical protein
MHHFLVQTALELSSPLYTMKKMDALAVLQTSLNFPDQKIKETNTKESQSLGRG